MSARPGMTLLETLVAATVLASLTTLAATLWSQAARWAGEPALAQGALRNQHAVELLRAQWAARPRGVALVKDQPQRVRVDGERLEFITTRSALFSGWPLVRAAYVIEAEQSRAPGAAQRRRLVYEELRLGRLDAAVDDGARTPDSADLRRRTLLEACDSLGWRAVARAEEGDAPVSPAVWVSWLNGSGTGAGAPLTFVADPLGVRLAGLTPQGAIECVVIDVASR
jgi:prepilin-type N-terminal cleavage/methylation domain-containing protein